jgi:hypothetical protein
MGSFQISSLNCRQQTNVLTERFEWIYVFGKWPYSRLLGQVIDAFGNAQLLINL